MSQEPERANPFGNFIGTTSFETDSPLDKLSLLKKQPNIKPIDSIIDHISNDQHFPSREAQSVKNTDSNFAEEKTKRRKKIARTEQLNVKVTPEYLSRFLAICDELSLSQVVCIEKAIEALENDLGKHDSHN